MAFYGNYYYIFFLKMSWLYKKSKATYTFDFNITILIIWHKRNKPYTYLHRIWLNHSITWVYYAFQSIMEIYQTHAVNVYHTPYTAHVLFLHSLLHPWFCRSYLRSLRDWLVSKGSSSPVNLRMSSLTSSGWFRSIRSALCLLYPPY